MHVKMFNEWQKIEKAYVKNMSTLLHKVRKQRSKIDAICSLNHDHSQQLEDLKTRFLDYLNREDNLQNKLDQFKNSFNKFTDEFPELRKDQETIDELTRRLDIFNNELWKIIETSKDENIAYRESIMKSGWIEHEMEQFTYSAENMLVAEIKRFLASCHLLHDHL